MKHVLLLFILIQYKCLIVKTKDCVSYYDETNKLINVQRCITNVTSCCGLCHVRFCCSVLNPFLPILDQNKCDNNYRRNSSSNSNTFNSIKTQSDETDNFFDPFTNYGITVAIFVGLTFMISLFFIFVACCIICQKKRMQQQERCYRNTVRSVQRGTLTPTAPTSSSISTSSSTRREGHTNEVFTTSNQLNQTEPTETYNSPILEAIENNLNNNIYKPYSQISYDDPPPAYNTLKFN